jgi:small-conductance mechanosensitive channel
MEKILEFLQGKKTYIIAICVGIVAALNQLGIAIPAWVLPVLGALGLGAIRDAINKV